jgi:hypothetical protein
MTPLCQNVLPCSLALKRRYCRRSDVFFLESADLCLLPSLLPSISAGQGPQIAATRGLGSKGADIRGRPAQDGHTNREGEELKHRMTKKDDRLAEVDYYTPAVRASALALTGRCTAACLVATSLLPLIVLAGE